MNWQNNKVNKGKVVYWVDGQRFENSKDKRDGKQRAIDYCYANAKNPNSIQKFDSRTECNRYERLLELQEQGVIKDLDHHYTLLVQDKYENANGDTIPPLTYEADFVYTMVASGQRVVEDVKGSEYFLDERFITLKQVFDKIMLPQGLFIRVIMWKNNQWVEWHIGDAKKDGKLIKKQREEIKALRKEKHDREMKDKKEARDKKRLFELNMKRVQGVTLRSDEKKRLRELIEKYGD